MSDKKQETIADIVAEMRECDGYRAYYDGGLHHESGEESVVDVDYLHDFADRIEAAWKREKAEIEADALSVGAVVATTEKSSAVGNAAAMREALLEIKGLFRDIDLTNDTPENKAYAIAEAALSAPPRNCDVGTAEEQIERFEEFCDAHCQTGDGDCGMCSLFKSWALKDSCRLVWAQMPYEDGGAK